MTLRHRLLLVYGIVVLLSMATVGVAAFELRHAHRMIAELEQWNEVVLNVRKLRDAFAQPTKPADFADEVNSELRNLNPASDYLDFEQVRHAFYDVWQQSERWQHSSAGEKPALEEQ